MLNARRDVPVAPHAALLASVVLAALAGACASTFPHNDHPSSPASDAIAPLAAEAAAPAQHEHAPAKTEWTVEGLSKGAALLPGLGAVHRSVTHRQAQAQKYFDQGLALTYGFNHDEAARSYARGGDVDPSCAMCFWGLALTLGPNYNMPMLPERAALAWDALSRARKAAHSASPVERALITALTKRYGGPTYLPPEEMQAYSQAYADAMRDVARRFPDDLDVQVLYAEARMNLNPWKLWTSDGKPNAGTQEIVATLESVLARDANHAGANHYYIHAVEASSSPKRAERAADRLGSMVPGAGHLVHMPAHIYQRIGRYADASRANWLAVQADERYMATLTPPGYYGFYLGHNYGFLAYSASMEGRRQDSLAAAELAAVHLPKDLLCGMPGMDFFKSEPLLVMVRFGLWDEILAAPAPQARYPVLRALWHHARGMALAAKGVTEAATGEVESIRAIAAELPEALIAGLNNGRDVLELSVKIVEARIAENKPQPRSDVAPRRFTSEHEPGHGANTAHQGKNGRDASSAKDAVTLWREAVALEDALSYNEPADWFYPTRHYLGALLLERGRAAEAEDVYREDLRRNPRNGWALHGLSRALAAQGKTAAADEAQREFREAWRNADFELRSTAF
jgi:tetratricopeptide (TPR) repeat protein